MTRCTAVLRTALRHIGAVAGRSWPVRHYERIAAFAWARPGNPARRDVLPLLLFLLGGLMVHGSSAQAAATGWVGDGHAAARLITAVEATGSNARLDAGLQIRLAPGWHAYWRTPGDGGLPPSIDWQGSENVGATTISWPAPRRFSLDGLETQVYDGGVVLPISVHLMRPGEPALLRAEVDYAACKDVCVPYHASLALRLPSGLAAPGAEAPLIAAARDRIPVDFASAGLRILGAVVASRKNDAVLSVQVASNGPRLRAPDLFVEDLPRGSPGRLELEFGGGGTVATLSVPIRGVAAAAIAGARLRLTLADGARSAETEATPLLGELPPAPGSATRIGIFGVALLGGLVLNLMPCVLPVLSLKLLALTGYAGAVRRTSRPVGDRAGVIVCFAGLAGMLTVLKAAGAVIGWGIQFQQPWFLAGMALVTTLFAASLWDWLPLALPGGVAGAVGSVRGQGR